LKAGFTADIWYLLNIYDSNYLVIVLERKVSVSTITVETSIVAAMIANAITKVEL
jgi:hypothetical protein